MSPFHVSRAKPPREAKGAIAARIPPIHRHDDLADLLVGFQIAVDLTPAPAAEAGAGTSRPAPPEAPVPEPGGCRHRPVARGRTPPACLALPPAAARTLPASPWESAFGIHIPGTRPRPQAACPRCPSDARNRTTRSSPSQLPALRSASY